MSAMTGIRSIMDDIAAASSGPDAGDLINLSPGNPAVIPEVVEAWRHLVHAVADEQFDEVSGRYGPSRGSAALIGAVVDYFGDHYGWPVRPEHVVVGSGAQMLCFLAAAAFTSRKRPLVLPRLPDYAGYFGIAPRDSIVGIPARVVPTGRRGFRYRLDTDALGRRRDVGMYLLSSPANPTGSSLDADEMRHLLRAAETRDVPMVVDNAYGEPFPAVVDGVRPPVWHPNVINCFTLSKAGLPGERIGFMIGDPNRVRVLVAATANVALHAPGLAQAVVARAMGSGVLDTVSRSSIAPFYRQRRRVVEQMVNDCLDPAIRWRLHECEGGMFAWLWIDEEWFDDAAAYDQLKGQGVLVVPGRHFFADTDDAHARRCIRLSISGDLASLRTGIDTLGRSSALRATGRGLPSPRAR